VIRSSSSCVARAFSISDAFYKASALVRIAREVAVADPGRATRLIEYAGQFIAGGPGPDPSPLKVALVLSDSAEGYRALGLWTERRLLGVWMTTSECMKASALAGIAEAVAATDPRRSVRLIADAAHFSRALPEVYKKECALTHVAAAVAGSDPDHAQDIASSIRSDYFKAAVLAGIAGAMVQAGERVRLSSVTGR